MKINKLILMTSVCLIILLSGCKTSQKAAKTHYKKNITCCEILKKTDEAQPHFKTMNISKMNMSIYYGQYSFTFKSSIRIATDSIISISIQPALGIEMFRLEMTPENFTVYDKFNRRYAQNDYEYIKLRWGIDLNYKTFESLLSHKIFTPETSEYTNFCDAFKIENLSDTTTIIGKNAIQGMVQQFDISMLDNRITLTGVRQNNKNIISITYGELEDFNGIKFPKTVNLSALNLEPNITAQLEINKITFNKPLTSSSTNISRYTKIGLSDILHFK